MCPSFHLNIGLNGNGKKCYNVLRYRAMMIDSVKKAMEGGTEIKKERGVEREKQEKERVSEEDKDKDKEGDRGRKIEGSERKKNNSVDRLPLGQYLMIDKVGDEGRLNTVRKKMKEEIEQRR